MDSLGISTPGSITLPPVSPARVNVLLVLMHGLRVEA